MINPILTSTCEQTILSHAWNCIGPKKKPSKGEFYGPYPSAGAVRETLVTIQRVFKIRNCNDNYFNTRSRPCLQYQIKRCTAPCTGYITPEAYRLSVEDARRFVQGKSQLLLEELAKRMEQAVERLAFEEAATLRDQIKSLRLVQEQQAVVQLNGDADVIAIEAKPGFACIQSVTVREGQIMASQSFFPKVPSQSLEEEHQDMESLWQDVFYAYISFHYIDHPERIPALIITHEPIAEHKIFEAMLSELRGKRCRIQIRPRGLKAGWLDFCLNNLQRTLADHLASATTTKNRYFALSQLLGRDEPIFRMECFDISHTQGNETVASCVVFDEKGPSKADYRRFNIQNITAGDDYAAMEQAISRRYKFQPKESLPDLLIIDGGKGQVAVAQRVLSKLEIESICLIGIAKGIDRKAGWERLILVAQGKEITLPSDSAALHLLQHIRDEAHRFAINSHRKRRQKAGLQSSLESIEGVGPKRRQALLRRFGGLRELAKAPLSEIAKVNGVSNELAARIFAHFHP